MKRITSFFASRWFNLLCALGFLYIAFQVFFMGYIAPSWFTTLLILPYALRELSKFIEKSRTHTFITPNGSILTLKGMKKAEAENVFRRMTEKAEAEA